MTDEDNTGARMYNTIHTYTYQFTCGFSHQRSRWNAVLGYAKSRSSAQTFPRRGRVRELE